MRIPKLGIASAHYFGSEVREEDGELTKERSGGEPEWEPNGAGIMRVMMREGQRDVKRTALGE